MRQTRKEVNGKTETRRFSCKRCPWVERSANCVDRRLLDAARSLDIKGAKAAVADGARLGAKDGDGETALTLARKGDSPELRDYLQGRVMIESTETLNGGQLSGKFRRIDMSELQAQEDLKCPEGRLLAAAKDGDLGGVKAALAEGADPDVKDADGKDAMARASDPEVVRYLRILKLRGNS